MDHSAGEKGRQEKVNFESDLITGAVLSVSVTLNLPALVDVMTFPILFLEKQCSVSFAIK